MNKMREAFEKYAKAQQEMLAYHGGTCNANDFEAGYQAAIAAVKEGGPYLTVRSDVTIGASIDLYKLPED